MDNKQERIARAWSPGLAMHLAKLPEWQRAHAETLAEEIATRLRAPCAHLTDDAFAELVMAITRTRLRFEAIDSRAAISFIRPREH